MCGYLLGKLPATKPANSDLGAQILILKKHGARWMRMKAGLQVADQDPVYGQSKSSPVGKPAPTHRQSSSSQLPEADPLLQLLLGATWPQSHLALVRRSRGFVPTL
jgi:hypothetical protein